MTTHLYILMIAGTTTYTAVPMLSEEACLNALTQGYGAYAINTLTGKVITKDCIKKLTFTEIHDEVARLIREEQLCSNITVYVSKEDYKNLGPLHYVSQNGWLTIKPYLSEKNNFIVTKDSQ